jgi:hypothetical protein
MCLSSANSGLLEEIGETSDGRIPRPVSLLATLARLTAGEAMSDSEQLRTSASRTKAALRAAAATIGRPITWAAALSASAARRPPTATPVPPGNTRNAHGNAN